ncbi:MAG: phage minor capsid protein [Faecalibacterium sp.]
MARGGHRCLRLQKPPSWRQAVDGLADGMPMVTYPSGPHRPASRWPPRRAVLTGVNQTTGKLQVARMDEMGCEFVETDRPRRCPSFSMAEWQGRALSHRGGAVGCKGRHCPTFEAATGYGTGAGLCGWNCRHTFFAVFPELGDPPQWTQEQLRELNARNIEWNGKKYTATSDIPDAASPASGTSATLEKAVSGRGCCRAGHH